MSKVTTNQLNLASVFQPTYPQDTLKDASSVAYKPYLSLEAWRGLASIMVVIFHACDAADSTLQLGKIPFYNLCIQGHLGVQIFFVLSGYCIANAAASCLRKQATIGSYITARIRRIYPPYLATVVFTMIVAVLAAHLVKSGAIAHSMSATSNVFAHSILWYISTITLSHQIFQQPNIVRPAWTLNYEVAFYFIVGLFLAGAMRLRSERILLNGLHIFTLGALLWIIAAPTKTIYPFNLWPEFGIGVAAYDIIANQRHLHSRIAFAAITILSIMVAAVHNVQGYSAYGGTRIEYSTVAVFSILLVLLHKYDVQISKQKIVILLASIGTFSYSLYLTHELVRGIVSQIGRKTHVTTGTYFIELTVQVVLALLMGRLFFIVFERPFMSKKQKKIITITTHEVAA